MDKSTWFVIISIGGVIIWLAKFFVEHRYVFVRENAIPMTDDRRRQLVVLERQRRQTSPDYENLDFVG